MSVVILIELHEPTDARILRLFSEEPEPEAVRLVHAAPVLDDLVGTTLCGLPTAPMLPTHRHPAVLGEHWPHHWQAWICKTCDASLHSAV